VAVRTASRPRGAAVALAALVAANGAAIVVLWIRAGGVTDIDDLGSALSSAGRLAGLLGAAAALLALLLLARIPLLDRLYGFDRLAAWHRVDARACIALLLAHVALILAGYTIGDRISLWAEVKRLVSGYPGVITAIAGLAILVAVVVTSVVAVRRRLRYETWWFVHLYAYLAIALAFSHQIDTGTAFVGDGVARAYWTALYVAVLAVLVVCRIAAPIARSAWHDLRVERVVEEAPGVVSIEIGGRRLEHLRARSGQFLLWRFLTRDRWWEAHPFSLSARPDGRRLRITVKSLGDFTERLGDVRPGTRVIVEGPFGAFTTAARRRPRVALIAGGVGITPIRALLEDMPGDPGDITVIYRALSDGELILREELEALARRRGTEVHYVIGDHRAATAGELLSPEHLRALVPDIATRDVYVCGPPAMAEATRASLLAAAVPRRQIVTERFAL
jgi:predicted ferric reductase